VRTGTAGNHSSQGSTVPSAWTRRQDLAENACPECQGSAYVPGPMHEGRMVDECPECKGTGKDATKKAA
jgi:DnaJ-class molecular chaperone